MNSGSDSDKSEKENADSVTSLRFQIVNPTENPTLSNMSQSPDPRNQYFMTGQHIQDPRVFRFQANTGAYQYASRMGSQQNAGQLGFQRYARAQLPFNISGQGHESPGPSSAMPVSGTLARPYGPHEKLPQAQSRWPSSKNFQAPAQTAYHGQVHEASDGSFGGTLARPSQSHKLAPLQQSFSDQDLFARIERPPVELGLFPTSTQNLRQLAQGQPQRPDLINFQAPAQMAYHGNVFSHSHRMSLPPIQSRAPQVTQAIPTSTLRGQQVLTHTQRAIGAMRARAGTHARSSSVPFDPYAPQYPALVQAVSSSTPLQKSTAATRSRPTSPVGFQASHSSASVNPHAASNLTLAQLQSLTQLERSNLHMSRQPWPKETQGVLVIPHARSSSTPSKKPREAMGSRQPLPAGNQASSSAAPVDPNAVMEHIRADRMPWEEDHQIIGTNCYFCKRDLSYPPDGPIIENSLPGAAVLPCGHAFHEVCLEKITPEDQKYNPPCIPCVIPEND